MDPIQQAKQDARRAIQKALATSNPKAWLEETLLRAHEEFEYAQGTRLETYWRAYYEEVKRSMGR